MARYRRYYLDMDKQTKNGLSNEKDDQNADELFEQANTAWKARDFATVRGVCAAVLKSQAAAQRKSYAHLRIAQSYLAEGDSEAAGNAYAEIEAYEGYPEVHRFEASERRHEIERQRRKLPPRDPEAKKTALPPFNPSVEYFVSTDGSDDGDGSRDRPFESLERARDAVRAAMRSTTFGAKRPGEPSGGIAITVMPGEYRLSRGFELSTKDSGTADARVVYTAESPPVLRYSTAERGSPDSFRPTILRSFGVCRRNRRVRCFSATCERSVLLIFPSSASGDTAINRRRRRSSSISTENRWPSRAGPTRASSKSSG